jgi:glycosyltransferase involved in cell wall biosynthesis
MPRRRLLALASHVIQYQAPFYRLLASQPQIELEVMFCSDWGVTAFADPGFGQRVKWDVPLLDGYGSEFLRNWSPNPDPSRLLGLINPAIIGHIRSGNFDALLVHGWGHATTWMAMLAAMDFGLPLIMRGESNLLPHITPCKAAVKNAILRSLFKRISGFLAIGRLNAEFYRHYGVPDEKIFMAPYSVHNNFFINRARELAPQRIALRRKLGVPDHIPAILFSGKLIPKKRPMDLLRAFERISSSRPAALIYLGDGSLRGELEQYIRCNSLRNVFFVGFKNQTEIPEYFTMADVFALPSGPEPWGLVVNEALCFGLPAIVSDQVGSAGDLVRQGVNGCIFQAGDIAQLAEALDKVLSDSELRQSMSAASRDIIQHWGYEQCLDGVLRCLEDVTRGKSNDAVASA